VNAHKTRVHCQLMLEKDYDEIIRIEQDVFSVPWTREELQAAMRNSQTIGCVAVMNYQIVEYCVYRFTKTRIEIENLAVDRQHWKQGIGSALVSRLYEKLSKAKRRSLRAVVVETNVNAQCFLRSCGFEFNETIRQPFDSIDRDAYVFVKSLQPGRKDYE